MHGHDELTDSGRKPRMRLGRAAVLVAVVMALVAAGCGSSSKKSATPASSGGDTEALLGPKQPATGTPVKVGFIGDGLSANQDQTIITTTTRTFTKYLNERKGGFAGHPIDLVVCEAQADAAKSGACATQMIQAKVSLVIMGPMANTEAAWKPLHDAKIVTAVAAAAASGPVLDHDSTLLFVDPTASLASLPIAVAQDTKLSAVTVVSIDVPAATGYYKALGAKVFGDAGVKMNLVPIPPGQADVLPQMSTIASGNPVEVHIVGDDKLGIAAVKGLKGSGFKGPISCIGCDGSAVAKALGSDLKGIYAPYANLLSVASDPDTPKLKAIMKAYGPGDNESKHREEGYIIDTMLPLNQMLADMKGDFTTENIMAAARAFPGGPLPSGGGLYFRCNGKASAIAPSSCVKGVLVAQVDANGFPTPPFKPAGGGPVSD
jgi:branched-chain amino acid transport system substrate-binding protein